MKSLTIKGSLRPTGGKKIAKQERGQGSVLCALYGAGEQINFSVPALELRDLVYTPNVYTVNLEIDGKTYNAIMQDIQFHAVTDNILHIDFLQINENKPVTMQIPVRVTGNSIGVKAGGKLVTKVRKVKVKAMPSQLPDFIGVNIDTLDIGQAIRISDIKLDGVTILETPANVITQVQTTRAVAEAANEAKGKK